MPIDHSATYAAEPDAVLAILTDEAFQRERAAALGVRVHDVDTTAAAEGPQTTVRLVVPTVGIPPVFARFVGAEVSVVDRQSWTADDECGHAGVLDICAGIFGRTARVHGERRLIPAAGGDTRSTVTGEAQVDAPLIGRQAESAVRELALIVLRREHELLQRRLGARP